MINHICLGESQEAIPSSLESGEIKDSSQDDYEDCEDPLPGESSPVYDIIKEPTSTDAFPPNTAKDQKDAEEEKKTGENKNRSGDFKWPLNSLNAYCRV